MRITDLKTFVVGNPPPGFGGRYFIFVKLVTDDGIEGVGEVYARPFGPHVVASDDRGRVRALRRRRGPVPDRDAVADVYSRGYTPAPRSLARWAFSSGIEMACWDIIGKEVGKPVYELLGGRVHERLRSYTYHLSRAGRPDDCVYNDPELAAERAAEYVDAGLHRASSSTRPGPTRPSIRASRRSNRWSARSASSGMLREAVGDQGRPAVRHPRPVHRVGRDPARAAARALRSAVVRGAGAARDAGGDGAWSRARPRSRSRPASG